MLGFLDLEMNKRIGKHIVMGLANILSSVKVNNKNFNLNPEFTTIRYISEKEYANDVYKYVEPDFSEYSYCAGKQIPRFIIFSAPGATGKTALAQHICYLKNGIYWNLPDTKVAEYSLQGTIQNAVGAEHLSDFYKSIKNGDDFLVIDAFDEAEAGSGRSGIEFFLRDLNTITKDCNHICAILMARTESALFIKGYLKNNNIPFIHYEVKYFTEHNAKIYIKNGLEKLRVPITNIVDQCLDAQFEEIKRILLGKDTESFIGYAPVLNALTEAYDEERNTLNLLKGINNSEENCQLLKNILDGLLERERKKFSKALQVKLPKITDCSLSVYDGNEQLLRIFGKLAYDDETLFIPEIDESIPIEFHDEYLEVVSAQLSQHPFIKIIEKDGEANYEFTGIAFRDFIIAYCLALRDCSDFVREYINGCDKYCPSQLLVEYYNIFSKANINGIDIPLMYNSFKAHAQISDKVTVHINGDRDDCSVDFSLERDSLNALSLEFNINNLEKGIHIEQLSNCYIDIDGKVFVGNSKGEARIYNSTINCNEIIWRSEQVSIEAYSPGECSLIVNSMDYTTNGFPRFEVKTDEKKNLKVSCPTLRGYYKLIPYHVDENSESSLDNFTMFANLIRRIFSCLRSHSKDAPARKTEFIDNRIIGVNEDKKNIFTFLLDEGVLYTDEQDWLYKLETDKLSDYAIKWQDVREGNFNSLKTLYSKYNGIFKL